MTKVICKLTPEIDARRTKRTGLKIEHYQPRPAERGSNLGDCAIRSACWATGEDWETVYKEMQDHADANKRRHRNILKAGTPMNVIKYFYRKRGWTWVDTKHANVLFKAENLPKQLCVAITTSHAVAVEDHVVLDSFDSRGDRSCVLEGYFVKKR